MKSAAACVVAATAAALLYRKLSRRAASGDETDKADSSDTDSRDDGSSDCTKCAAGEARVAALEREIAILTEQRASERAGRTRAEKRLRELRQDIDNREGTPVMAVGVARTPFVNRFGTPRQGLLAPDAVGQIVLNQKVIQGVALDGLQEHSHVWVSFLFHTNTNQAKKSNRRKKVFPAKIAPPVLGGKRVGIFSTRSPHRPNPVGLTLLRLESVDTKKGILHVSGLDLVDETPIIDIKPYMPPYDSKADATCPGWVIANWPKRTPVEFAPAALEQLQVLLPSFKLYPNTDAGLARVLKAMEQALSLDMRSAHKGRGKVADDDDVYRWDFDAVTACWCMQDGVVVVKRFERRSKSARAKAVRVRNGREVERRLQRAKAAGRQKAKSGAASTSRAAGAGAGAGAGTGGAARDA